MAKVSLRAYNRDIESLTEQNQIDEAIAHCKFILKQYPKHIDTYRLLGKAYLESRRYTEAADILHRVLSVVPDDFVANLGMSIIREDEGNLDAAIWHMERSFEFQPSNPAIQNELQRLRGRRDGIEPPKVRLTRGALVRMYERGELYPQAVAEIRAALSEDPKRIDLSVIQARVYHKNNQNVEATDACIRLVSKLPYCYEANRILSEILPSTARAEDARVYKQRLTALDPYSAFISEQTPLSSLVPDNAVQVERLDWQPTPTGEIQPEWAQSIGVDLEEEESIPSWMDDFPYDLTSIEELPQQEIAPPMETQPQDETPVSQDETVIPAAEEKDELIPDWMKEAGWLPSSEAMEQPPSSQETTGELDSLFSSSENEEISPADIPDWLKDLAPEEPEEELSSSAGVEELEKIFSDSESNLPMNESVEENLWLKQEAPSSHQEPDFLTGGDQVPQDFSKDEFEVFQPLPPGVQPFVEDSTSKKESVEESIKVPAPDSSPIEQEELPDWLKDFKDLSEPEEILTAPGGVAPTSPVGEIKTPPADIDEAMAWLESLAARQGAEEESLTIPPEQRRESPPEWLDFNEPKPEAGEVPQDIFPESEIEAASLPASEPVPDESPKLEEASFDLATNQVGIEQPPAFSGETLDDDAAFAWLESLAAKQGADESTLLSKPEDRIEIEEEKPSWVDEGLGEEIKPIHETLPAESEEPPVTTFQQEPIPPIDALPEWLRGIEQEHLPQPEKPDSLPEWLQEIEPPASEEPQITPEFNRSEWINELEIIKSPERDLSEETISLSELDTGQDLSREDTLPDWLKDLEEETATFEKEILTGSDAQQIEETVEPAPVLDETGLQPPASLELLEQVTVEAPEIINEEPLSVEKLASELATAELHEVEEEEPLSESETASTELPQIPMDEQLIEVQSLSELSIPEITETITKEPLSEEQPQMDEGDARRLLQDGKLAEALSEYSKIIQSGNRLDDTIKDLQDAVYHHPVEIEIWQLLGDALAKSDRLQDALDAYTKAEELLK